jgi:CubicO group peptidase (beta-lactamase class C family)
VTRGLLFFFLAAHLTPLSASPITAKNFALADRYSMSHGGLALRVQQGGRIVFEDYAEGYSASTPHKIYSGTKNFVAVTALIAEQEGLLNLSEPASKTLTEWRGDRRRTITLNQLLSQTSGLSPSTDLINSSRDQMQAAVSAHLIATPGTQFHYGPVGYQAFGEILKRKLRPSDRSVEDYMNHKLFDPLDIDIASWKHDDAGNPLMHAGLALSSEEWAKFGEFVKSELLVKSEFLLSTKLLVQPQLFKILFTGHYANPAYGISFWLNRPPPSSRLQKMADLQPAMDGEQMYSGGPRDIYAAYGTSHQRLYIIPSLDLVIVRFSEGSRFSDGDFLSRLLTGRPHPDLHVH